MQSLADEACISPFCRGHLNYHGEIISATQQADTYKVLRMNNKDNIIHQGISFKSCFWMCPMIVIYI